jgi:glucosylceramidase
MHCYGGDFSVQQNFHKKWQGLASLNSECTANLFSKTPQFDFQWWLENQVVDSTQIGSRGALAWNLCLDEKGGPRNNGCSNCRGLVTINKAKKTIETNAEYYALAQVSRFVRRGARVVDHIIKGDTALRALTFLNPDGSLVLVVRNPTGSEGILSLQIGGDFNKEALRVPAQSAITYQFQ